MIRLAGSLTIAALALVPACKRDGADPEDTQKVIEVTREEVAQTRTDIDQKQEDVIQEQGDVSGDRTAFIGDTQAELDDIDRRIQELRGQVEVRAKKLEGEAQQDLRLAMTDLESARDAARDALERFRESTTPRAVDIKRATEQALGVLRHAYEQMSGRLHEQGDDHRALDRDARRLAPVPPTPAYPAAP